MAENPVQHGPRWRVRWTHPDTRKRASHVLDSKPEAGRFKDWLEEHGDRILKADDRIRYDSWDGARLDVGDGGSMTFGEYMESYFLTLESVAAASKYRERVHARASDWLHVPLKYCDRPRLDALVKRMKTEPIAPSTAYNALTVISAVLGAAHGEGRIKENPFRANPTLRRRKLDPKKATGFDRQGRLKKDHELRIPRAEWDKLLDAAAELGRRTRKYGKNDPEQLYYMLWLLTQSGMRIGEALAVQVSDCIFDDSEDPFIDLSRTRQRDGTSGPTKSRRSREVSIDYALAEALQKHYCAGRHPDAALFPAPLRGDDGWRYETWYGRRWKPLLALARAEFGFNPRIQIHPHALRMAFITWAYNDGVPGRDISLQVGHTSERITKGYDLGSDRRAVREAQGAYMPGRERKT